MGRSVVRAGAVRCHSCRLAPRWCVCRALPQATTAIQVDVLMHPQEQCKPSSTGKLIERAVQGARCQLYQRGSHQHGGPSPPSLAALQAPELWILHPLGEPLESIQSVIDSSTPLRVLLLDGNWSQAGEMLRTVESMGRCVRLAPPDTGCETNESPATSRRQRPCWASSMPWAIRLRKFSFDSTSNCTCMPRFEPEADANWQKTTCRTLH